MLEIRIEVGWVFWGTEGSISASRPKMNYMDVEITDILLSEIDGEGITDLVDRAVDTLCAFNCYTKDSRRDNLYDSEEYIRLRDRYERNMVPDRFIAARIHHESGKQSKFKDFLEECSMFMASEEKLMFYKLRKKS